MYRKIKELLQGLKRRYSYDACYTQREKEGYAIFEKCCRWVGGTWMTGYLSERCVDCPYYIELED